jgi:hypothetical protein
MRLLRTLLVLALFASVGVANPGSAALVPFEGVLSLTIGTLPTIPIPGGGVATVNGSAGGDTISSLVLPSRAFVIVNRAGPTPGVTTSKISLVVPNAFPIVQLMLRVANGAITVTSGGSCTAGHPNVSCPGGGLAGFGGLQGSARVGLFYTHTAASSSGTQPVFNLTVPLGAVGGGSTTGAQGSGITVQLSGAGWTTGTVGVYNPLGTLRTHIPSTFHVFPTLSFTASSSYPIGTTATTTTFVGSRDTSPGGAFFTDTITLVSPIQIFNNAQGGFAPSVATISIQLLPEPGGLLLLGAGAAALALYGRRRAKR